jgi:hypothetical protein
MTFQFQMQSPVMDERYVPHSEDWARKSPAAGLPAAENVVVAVPRACIPANSSEACRPHFTGHSAAGAVIFSLGSPAALLMIHGTVVDRHQGSTVAPAS